MSREVHTMTPWRTSALIGLALSALVSTGCAFTETASTPSPSPSTRPPATASKTTPARELDPQQTDRLRRTFLTLIKAMDHPRQPNQVKVGIIDDPSINAASAGGGEFYVTTGLLQKANDRHLMGVLAHELAHDDLGHVAKAQALATGLGIGAVILDQIIPGSGRITPIAGQLISRAYSRNEEYAADRHGMEILRKAGQPPEIMVDTLTWLVQTEGGGSGGFFATHPATQDRIEALKK
jgi:predicted Zn-dependent protease